MDVGYVNEAIAERHGLNVDYVKGTSEGVRYLDVGYVKEAIEESHGLNADYVKGSFEGRRDICASVTLMGHSRRAMT